MISKKATIVNM